MICEKISIYSPLAPIELDIKLNANAFKMPLVILLHGFRGYKEWGFFPFLLNEFASKNIISIAANFSTEQIDSINHKYKSLELFSISSLDIMINDTLKIIDFIKSDEFKYRELWNNEIYLFGYSFGAACAAFVAEKCKSIKKMCLTAPVGKLDRYSERHKNNWLQLGYWKLPTDDLHQELYLKTDFLNSVLFYEKIYPLALSEIDCEIAFICGANDCTVRTQEIKRLINLADLTNYQFYEIKKANHTFGISRFFERPTPELNELKDTALNFFL